MDEWFALEDQLIDYAALTDLKLSELVLAGDDVFVATSALSELSIRKSALAGPTALKLFEKDIGDQWLQSVAFAVLYEFKRQHALAVIDNVIETSGLHMTKTIVECLDFEEIKSYCSDPGLLLQLKRIIKRVNQLGAEHFEDPAFIQRFLHFSQACMGKAP